MSEQGIEGVQRPAAVTVVAALVWVNAALDLVAGVVFLIAAAGDVDGNRSTWVIMGSISLVLGAIAAVVALGLMRGNAVARIAITVIEAFSIIASAAAAVANPETVPNEIVSALIALAILLLVWSRESTRYFRGLAPDQPDER
ncbi:hypothetical protein GCM10009819_21380 [Agromyces tropicus]|uniref:Uncharacterized protein n=1 Tax=Agromyces tropicus TaxID=555371 RepID=A0ABN2UFG3_9MICO